MNVASVMLPTAGAASMGCLSDAACSALLCRACLRAWVRLSSLIVPKRR